MGYKKIIKGKSTYFCDVCMKELNILEESVIVYVTTIWGYKVYHLCKKHGKKVKKFIKELKEQEGI